MRKAELLTDQLMQDFIRNGYATIHTDFPADFHRNIYSRMESILEKSGNPGNNLLPRIPEIQEVFDHPAVHGTLSSILGPSYYAHPHRYCHVNPPNTPAQTMHKDGYSKRHHRTRWAMAFYYPQDTPVEMGPTGVVEGSQYFNISPYHGRETPLTGEAGTVVIVNYDLWHRGTLNTGDRKRYMLKFLFARLDEPETPDWRSESAEWQGSDPTMDGLWKSVWNWHRGQPDTHEAEQGDVAEWVRRLQSGKEAAQFQAAYALSAMGERGVDAVAGLLASDDPALRRNAGYALTAAGAHAVDALTRLVCSSDTSEATRASALDILGDIGKPAKSATPVVADALRDTSVEVRRAAAEAPGTMGGADASVVDRLGEALGDTDEWVCRNAALSLLRIGADAEPATPALIAALRHDNRYVRLKTARTLERIGAPQALEAALNFYRANVWCPITDTTTPF